MPRLQVPEKEPRKRRSTTAIREDEESRKKVANVPEGAAGEEEGKEGEEEIDMSDIMAEIKEIAEARRKDEQRSRDNGMRVEKKARMRPRPLCCWNKDDNDYLRHNARLNLHMGFLEGLLEGWGVKASVGWIRKRKEQFGVLKP
ncbi:MAG: hypothetical protein Q9217_006214 [Psora testacea]